MSDSYEGHGNRVRITSGSAAGCQGTIRTSFSSNARLWYGIELDEACGRNDGKDKDGEYRFRCAPMHGIYVQATATMPILHHDDRYGPDMMGRAGVEADDPAVALTGDLHHRPEVDLKDPIAPWGSSYTKAYEAGDWERAHETSKDLNSSWIRNLDDVEAMLLDKKTELIDLKHELQDAKIKGDWEEADQISKQMETVKEEVKDLRKARNAVAHEQDDVHTLEVDHRNANNNLQLEKDLKRVESEMAAADKQRRRPNFDAVRVTPVGGNSGRHGVYQTDLSVSHQERDVGDNYENVRTF